MRQKTWARQESQSAAGDAALRSRVGRARVARIGDLTDAPDACVAGTVRATKILLSPGTATPCIAYQFVDSMGRDERRAIPFVIEDDSGHAVIEPSRAILLVAPQSGDGLHRATVGSSYLRYHRHPGSHSERCVKVGQRIYVIGACTRELDARSDGRPLYRDRLGSRLRFGHRDDMPLVLADRLTSRE